MRNAYKDNEKDDYRHSPSLSYDIVKFASHCAYSPFFKERTDKLADIT